VTNEPAQWLLTATPSRTSHACAAAYGCDYYGRRRACAAASGRDPSSIGSCLRSGFWLRPGSLTRMPAQRLLAATRPPLDHACAAAYGRDHVYQSSLRSGYDCDTNPRVPSLRGGFLAATTSRSLTRLRGGFRPRLVRLVRACAVVSRPRLQVELPTCLRGGFLAATTSLSLNKPARRLSGRDGGQISQACAAASWPRPHHERSTRLRGGFQAATHDRSANNPAQRLTAATVYPFDSRLRSGLRLRRLSRFTRACAAAIGCDSHSGNRKPAQRLPSCDANSRGFKPAQRLPAATRRFTASLRGGYWLRPDSCDCKPARRLPGRDRMSTRPSLRGGCWLRPP